MKIRTLFIGAALAGALNCAAVNAQVLGGNVAGGLGGTLSGGMRDTSILTRGNGSLSGDLSSSIDSSGMRQATGDTAGRATDRVRNTAGGARNRAESAVGHAQSTVGTVRDTTANVPASATGTATHTVNTQQLDAATNVAGTAAPGAVMNNTANETPTETPRSLIAAGAPEGSTSSDSTMLPATDKAPPDVSHVAQGAASGEGSASASKQGISVESSASAEGRGSASLSTPH